MKVGPSELCLVWWERSCVPVKHSGLCHTSSGVAWRVLCFNVVDLE